MFLISRFRNNGTIIITSLIVLITAVYVIRNGFLGANTDWMSQHTVFPEYFRRLFYETGDLFPNYAPQLGAGQNLYNFSYYGFLNPVILVSYLLPFVKMPAYIMATSLVSLMAACLIFYKWLKSKGFSNLIIVSAAIIFLLASPMFYHTYKQIIFVNYMPFLCLALIGVDRYFETRKKVLLTVSVFLMIMSSFYFSVSGLAVLFLYWLSVNLKEDGKCKVRDLIRSGVRFMIPIATAILMAGILLIPTFASLFESHRDGQTAVPLYTLFLPQFKLLRYVYSAYGLGLPSIVITALMAGLFYKKRNERILALGMVLITVFPVFLFLLNGGLYAQDKVLIPFLPIVCYLVALFFQKLEAEEGLPHKRTLFVFLGTAVLALLCMGQTIYWIIVFADAVLMLVLYLIYLRQPTVKLFIIPVIAILLVTNFAIQDPGKLVSTEIYQQVFEPDINTVMQEVSDKDSSFFRMDSFLNKDNNLNRINIGSQYLTSFYSSSFQKDYFDFRNDVFQLERPYRNYLMQPASQDPLFLTFMGVKYVRSDYAPAGYEIYKEKGNVKIFRNENVFPLGYVTNDLISEQDLDGYKFPYRQELLLHYAAINGGPVNKKGDLGASNFESQLRPLTVRFPESDGTSFSLKSNQGVYRVKAGLVTESQINLPKPAEEDEVLFLEMSVKNFTPLQDISVKIQNEQNRLSKSDHVYYNRNTVFHFAVSVKKGDVLLPVTFSAGDYQLSSVRSFTLSAADITGSTGKDSPFQVSAVNTTGDVIIGDVDAKESGYFITSVPYDHSFKITVDGKPMPYEKVNTAFVGFPVAKGVHHIVLHYVSPGFFLGTAASIMGFLIFGLLILTDRKSASFIGIPKSMFMGKNRGDDCEQ